MQSRKAQAQDIRNAAAELAAQRPDVAHDNNGEELRYRKTEINPETQKESNVPSHIANYTKGLPHDENGMLVRAADYQQLVRGIDSGDIRDFRDTPLGPEADADGNFEWASQMAQAGNCDTNNKPVPVRAWESAGAGHVFDLEGPDAQAVTMPPAPTLDSPELATEMLEVYSMALLRDVPFAQFNKKAEVQEAIKRLNDSAWIAHPGERALTSEEQSRLRTTPLTQQTVFRGITKGDDVGPYLSQFLLIGNEGIGNAQAITDGQIAYGAMRMDQRVRVAEQSKDYMTTWEAWLDVQNGADLRGFESYDPLTAKYRFITTPRDLATYVHYDALYQAYLNACVILLGMKAPFDPGLPFQAEDQFDKQQGFAHFGGPHILTLVTEVATRALKAVRYQKFNVHRRTRPEAIGGLLTRYFNADHQDLEGVQPLAEAFTSRFRQEIADHNAAQNRNHSDRSQDANKGFNASYLLPMAFAEGSPMHPAYGAGHGTVAGACVTILKAFFDHGFELPLTEKVNCKDLPVAYQPSVEGDRLDPVFLDAPLTVEGELNKLASNIAIGRNWAGVHYFSDYIESIRLGEQIAIGILQEQKLTYGENFSMTVPLFDGGCIRI